MGFLGPIHGSSPCNDCDHVHVAAINLWLASEPSPDEGNKISEQHFRMHHETVRTSVVSPEKGCTMAASRELALVKRLETSSMFWNI